MGHLTSATKNDCAPVATEPPVLQDQDPSGNDVYSYLVADTKPAMVERIKTVITTRTQRHDAGLVAVATTVNPPVSLSTQAYIQLDPTWTIDPGCTRHLTHESQWFADIAASGGSITVDDNNEIPIEGIGRVEPALIDSKGNRKRSPFMIICAAL
ncbi:hypothetical protein ON010_g2054 [Phytophthora cinnamomi]|nr:hypothetical protein ON010_g2054 [Phytophthora cinnamomi]